MAARAHPRIDRRPRAYCSTFGSCRSEYDVRDHTPALADPDRELLGNTLRSLRRAIADRGAPEQLLHGEPHPGNVLKTKKGFPIVYAASGNGAVYASGSTTLGGYFPGVDTFLGLQVSAQEIYQDLAKRGFGKRIGPVRSTTQWWKWLLGKQP